jgi:hypothetical protein
MGDINRNHSIEKGLAFIAIAPATLVAAAAFAFGFFSQRHEAERNNIQVPLVQPVPDEPERERLRGHLTNEVNRYFVEKACRTIPALPAIRSAKL